MPSRKRSPADAPGARASVHRGGEGPAFLGGVYQAFATISCSKAVLDQHGSQPMTVRRCLWKAFKDIKEGKLALYRSLQPYQFVSFACGFAVWTEASPDGSLIAVSELRKHPGGDLI